jgi:hypothetical protein
MNHALIAAQTYMMSDEGTVGTATVAVLMLACVVMLACLISYPEVTEAFALAG